MHLSTISRVVNRKYAHTPQGVFELRYFFSEAVNGFNLADLSLTRDGGPSAALLARAVEEMRRASLRVLRDGRFSYTDFLVPFP